jgi:4-carboxymuconolactone decarboxylase
MPRVTPIIEKADVAPEHHALFDRLAARRGRISGPSTIVLHSPELAGPWNEVSEFLHGQSIVEPRYAELAVCATARERDCAYVWAAHAPLGRKAGTSEAAIAAVRDRADVTGVSAADRDVVDYVRQLLRTSGVAAPLFERLREQRGVPCLVELTCLIGHYGIVTGILNAFEVAPAPDTEQLPLG